LALLLLLMVWAKPSGYASAAKAGVSPTSVGAVREELEANGEIPHKTERTEASGRSARE
jgi:hypothetical protein